MLEKVKLFKNQRLNDDGDIEQKCIKCNEWWPADTEFFIRQTKDRKGISSTCRDCNKVLRPNNYVGVNVCSQFRDNGYTCTHCPMPIDGCPVEMESVKER